jgi:hypothetical protein
MRCLEIRERVQGSEHPETLLAMSNLAAYRVESGGFSEAEALYRRCLASRQKVLGPMHPETLSTMDNLSGALRKKGALAESESIARASGPVGECPRGSLDIQTWKFLKAS